MPKCQTNNVQKKRSWKGGTANPNNDRLEKSIITIAKNLRKDN